MGLLNSLKSMLTPGPRVAPTEAGPRVTSGNAVLIDVREPAEWSGGVAKHAKLLPLSDLTGSRKQWRDFLSGVGNRELLLYCASGMRSGSAARLLAAEGFRTANTGGLGDWASAGWPVVKPGRG